jgi:hypothetical protein
MDMLSENVLGCPYCGEMISVLVDLSLPEQDYIEDCQVCCRPMLIAVRADSDGGCRVWARREDE